MDDFDIINGLFEFAGAWALSLNVRKLWKEKIVRGVHWSSVCFFSSWGAWNIIYYPHLEQWFSFIGGVALVLVNATWLIQILYYNHKENELEKQT